MRNSPLYGFASTGAMPGLSITGKGPEGEARGRPPETLTALDKFHAALEADPLVGATTIPADHACYVGGQGECSRRTRRAWTVPRVADFEGLPCRWSRCPALPSPTDLPQTHYPIVSRAI
jgi:hypothetical protein